LTVLQAAEAELSVKSVVLTSSSLAAIGWGAKGKIANDSYNEEFVNLAWDPSVEHPAKHFFVYAAAKTQAEQAAWKYVQEDKPHYAVNTILPNCNFGPSVNYEKQGHASTGGWAKALYDGDLSFISNVPPQYFIDVRDAARLHIAALINPETENERLWGFAEPYSWNSVLAIFRKLWPQKNFIEDLPGLGWDESIIPTESALKALKDVFGQNGWTGIETSLRESGFDRE
jgi:nucleoside-diphosphate-sugar epimerase